MLPSKNEINDIITGLSGWIDNPEMLAISYLPTDEETNILYELISKRITLSDENFKVLMTHKAQCANFQNFIINKPIKNIDAYVDDTKEFIFELTEETGKLNIVFDKLGFTDLEKDIFHLFVAKTSSILFKMGFSDATNHAGQVTRKCIVEAYKRQSQNYEIIQAAIVGWIHDPKVPLKYSWSNLTTHPVIASAIAINILNSDNLKDKLSSYLNSLNIDYNIEKFIRGTAEALAINNDSEYVLKHGILYRPSWASGPAEPGGIIDQILSMTNDQLKTLGIKITSDELAKIVEDNAISWFENYSDGIKMKNFHQDIELVLNEIHLETGIRGIILSCFEESIQQLSKKLNINKTIDAKTLFENMTNGIIEDQDLVMALSKKYRNDCCMNKYLFKIPTVSGLSLFCHNIEQENETIAASALEIADPLLLSPHKLLVEGVKDTVIEQMRDFILSFTKNINFLPKNAKIGGIIWQRDLYISILQAAEKLTNNDIINKYLNCYTNIEEKNRPFKTKSTNNIDILLIEKQVNELETLIQTESTWINKEKNFDYGAVNRKSFENRHLLEEIFLALKNSYDLAAEESPEMFGLVSIKV